MNFFEHQDRSRRLTRWLLVLFVLAVLAIIAVVDLILLAIYGFTSTEQGLLAGGDVFAANPSLLAGGAIGTGSVIGLASLYKVLTLRGGGGEVARQLGGSLVPPDTRDPLKRRLVNVVEEIALASGVPVPEVYLLERELGINAFAAGYSTSDAAVAVTRGTLESLNRSELQGVIAHEFSHILNGDMRINIRLMGALFGILLLAIIGRKVLYHSHYLGRGRNNSGFAIMAVAVALLAVGTIGLFFGRLIKAAVSRQREYLADASAVQFTRDPDGLAGSLKKIAIGMNASYLTVDTEEVGHMLFGPGRKMHMLATHPPLFQRISRIEPDFTEESLKTLAERVKRERLRNQQRQQEHAERAAQKEQRRGTVFDPETIIDQIGNPDFQRILWAAVLAEGLPGAASTAARQAEDAPETVLYALLHGDEAMLTAQMQVIDERLGPEARFNVTTLLKESGLPEPEQRLPLLEICLPSLHRQPTEVLKRLLTTIDDLIRVDGQIDVFEYLLARMVKQYLWESANPHRVRSSGRKSLRQCRDEIRTVLGIVARHGHPDDAEQAKSAFLAGTVETLGSHDENVPDTRDWVSALDQALDRLDRLASPGKEKLVRGLVATVAWDGEYRVAELELVRAVCTAIHVPLPALKQLHQT